MLHRAFVFQRLTRSCESANLNLLLNADDNCEDFNFSESKNSHFVNSSKKLFLKGRTIVPKLVIIFSFYGNR